MKCNIADLLLRNRSGVISSRTRIEDMIAFFGAPTYINRNDRSLGMIEVNYYLNDSFTFDKNEVLQGLTIRFHSDQECADERSIFADYLTFKYIERRELDIILANMRYRSVEFRRIIDDDIDMADFSIIRDALCHENSGSLSYLWSNQDNRIEAIGLMYDGI